MNSFNKIIKRQVGNDNIVDKNIIIINLGTQSISFNEESNIIFQFFEQTILSNNDNFEFKIKTKYANGDNKLSCISTTQNNNIVEYRSTIVSTLTLKEFLSDRLND